MFYAHIVLAKKGPLARIWLAAHWDKKLTKAHVFETNIEQSVEGIMQPKVKLALRTSGHLLLGVVRIYSRKAKYLLADCNEAFVKIKMAFRPGMVDLPEGHREANVNTITLPEVFHDFDTVLPELNDIEIEAEFSANQSRADEITLREDYGSISMSMHDDGFGEIGFDADTPDLVRDSMNSEFFVEQSIEELTDRELCITSKNPNTDTGLAIEIGFGNEIGHPDIGLFEGDLFGEPAVTVIDEQAATNSKICAFEAEDNFSDRAHSPISDSVKSKKSIPIVTSVVLPNKLQNSPHCNNESFIINDKTSALKNLVCEDMGREIEIAMIDDGVDQVERFKDEESFALAPIDASAYKGTNKVKRKRKLIVDEIKNISGEEMKAQLANTSDIIATLDLAPPTKRLMYWKETGGVEKLFSLPSRGISARGLFVNYQRHLIFRLGMLEDFSVLGPADVLTLEHIYQEHESSVILQNKRGRKRKQALQCDLSGLKTLLSNENPVSTDVELEKILPKSISQGPEASFKRDLTVITTLTSSGVRAKENEKVQGHLQSQNGGQKCLKPLLSSNSVTEIIFHDADILEEFNPNEPMPKLQKEIILSSSGLDINTSIQITNMHHASTILDQAGSDINIYSERAKDIAISNSENLATDWIDYDPVVIGQLEDEQLENETDEQFEERVLNKRAAQMFISVRYKFQKQDTILLSEITIGKSRKQAAQNFYSLLVLKKHQVLNIAQPGPYDEISVTQGSSFDNPKL